MNLEETICIMGGFRTLVRPDHPAFTADFKYTGAVDSN